MKLSSVFFIPIFLLAIGNSTFAKIQWIESFEAGKSVAQSEGKLMLVDFWAIWCGPCKKMDADVWDKPEGQFLVSGFVPVKIDIDINKPEASTYGVSSIPRIMIMDPWGEVLHESTGYMDMMQVKSLLTKFNVNMKPFMPYMSAYYNNEKGLMENYSLGKAYQLTARNMEEEGRWAFLRESEERFNLAEKMAAKEKNDILEQQVEILLYVNQVYKGKSNKAVSQFEKKIGLEEVNEKNMAVAYFFLTEAAIEAGEKELALEYMNKLRESPRNGEWLAVLTAGHIQP